jgi:hypothetical protein
MARRSNKSAAKSKKEDELKVMKEQFNAMQSQIHRFDSGYW